MAPPLLDADHTIFHSPPIPDTAVADGPWGCEKRETNPIAFFPAFGPDGRPGDPHLCI